MRMRDGLRGIGCISGLVIDYVIKISFGRYDVHFVAEFDAELLLDVGLDILSQMNYFGSPCAALVHQYEGLTVVYGSG